MATVLTNKRVGVIPSRSSRGIGPNGLPICRGCEKEVRGARFSWCSPECQQSAHIRAFPSFARHFVEKRDKGVCAMCGADAGLVERIIKRIRWRNTNGFHDSIAAVGVLVRVWGQLAGLGGHVPHLWEADHIVPVVEGGAGCGLENYRSLCVPCHRAETRALRRRMAERRRGQLVLSQLSVREIEAHDGNGNGNGSNGAAQQ